MSRLNARLIAEIGLTLALGIVLHMIPIYQLPQGGRITPGSLVPLFIISLRRGYKVGILTGAVFGLLVYLIEPFFVHPIQFILDYPLAFSLLGLSGFVSNIPIIGMILGTAGRLLSHIISGVVYFSSYAPQGMNPWVYSITYNASVILPDALLALIITILILPRLQKR
ncbi:energy-coupled thiamine transporter ThiT [bacterium]|nr:energy-coupled thiamine transporter ThiT [bacterium]